MTTYLSLWVIGFAITMIWGEKREGPLVWWAFFFVFFTWPVGLLTLIIDWTYEQRK